ncbi:hypothetical protein C8F04DRAFT_1227273 [Mycena alexandri]|uniref:Uncharacterized protein n=1 Tax=Mycena alexandri TaxID=1745969 RepID=A0AAD6TIF7_9AGAR|nr:hypothetical protein C8F04DRAFT_1227273 [Mycena alexandri]
MASDSEQYFMRSYAPPIRRDGFVCIGDDFYVQGRLNSRRANATDLHTLLTYTAPPPVLTKAGKVAKRQPRPHEDQSEEFYLAQVAHYGLKAVKTKDAAKRALLSAFGSKKTLAVPDRILKLEKEMREEYTAANKTAKVKYLEEKREEKRKEEERQNKRKRERDSAIEEFLQEGSWPPPKKGKTQGGKLQTSGELSGKFNVIAPFLTEQWDDATQDDMWLKLSSSSTNRAFGGPLISASSPGSFALRLFLRVGDPVAFFWRGRESGEGISTFGDRNNGTINFLGGGKFKAAMNSDLGDFKFAGTKLDGAEADVSAGSLREWKKTWRSINQRAYDRENVARWGKWGGDGDDGENPAGSDTTEGAESDEEGEYAGGDDYDSTGFAF